MISIIILNEDDLDKNCVYRIWFGHKYYIGSTRNSYERIIGHEKSLSEGFLWVNKVKPNSVMNIVRHLNEQGYINIGFFEVIKVFETREEAYDEEQKIFNECNTDPLCLNYLFTVRRSKVGADVALNKKKLPVKNLEVEEWGRKYNMTVYEAAKDKAIKPKNWEQLLTLLGFTEDNRPL